MELANSLKAEFEVIGSKNSIPYQHSEDIQVLPFDFNSLGWEKDLKKLLDADTVLLNIPPSGANTKEEFVLKSKSIIDLALESEVEHFLFISSTGVFANRQGTVDEKTAPTPERGNGKYLAELESHIADANFLNKHIIRPGGLVGGERHPIFFLAGRNNLSGRDHPVNLVHRKDLVNLTQAIINQRPEQTFFHAVAPDHPAKGTYYKKAAEYFHLQQPIFSDDSSSGKKVLSKLSAESLNFNYQYADLLEMLSSIRRA